MTLEQIAALSGDWCGCGAEPICPEIIERTRQALTDMEGIVAAPDLVPNCNGTISLDWDEDPDVGVAELEIGIATFTFYLKRKADAEPRCFKESGAPPAADLAREVAAALYA